jgi:hypothetical protein
MIVRELEAIAAKSLALPFLVELRSRKSVGAEAKRFHDKAVAVSDKNVHWQGFGASSTTGPNNSI